MCKQNDKKDGPQIPHAGMRPDHVRPDTGAAEPDYQSLREEIEWRKEHKQ